MITVLEETNRLEAGQLKIIQAESNSAHARINIPLNLEKYKTLAPPQAELVIWFHQHALDGSLTLKDCAEALDYDTSTISRILNGIYDGSWKNVCESISSYQRIHTDRGGVQQNEFVENGITKLIFGGLDYAMANNSITMIIGESRFGKTTAARAWRDRNNHGRSVFVTAPAYGGTKALLRDIAQTIGVGKNLSIPAMHDGILRGFNRNRILIIDEAHRLLPGDRRTNPVNLEIIRDLHDRTGCAVALLATQRFDAELKKSEYQFEQLLGRIGMPIRLPRAIKGKDIEPILLQYVRRPSERLQAACAQAANEPGRLGILVETLKLASRISSKAGQKTITEEHVFKAFALRKQMMGEQTYAAK